ncbi:MAG: SDR family NAD(P)-dependent oxidoreductase, partial [Oscillospiraceae bacterium]|nr:SDR family NAD(P)-dependent oxidoreductase [Oscillospiraceae bacterium]
PIFAEKGQPALGLKLDVTDRAAFIAAADAAEAKFGSLHVLVNNAGIANGGGPLYEVSPEQTELATSVNFSAILIGIQTIVPRMLKHGEDSYVVSTASKAGLVPCWGTSMYNVTKAAVITMMESLASDLDGTNVGAAAFCPGPHDTKLGISSTQITAEKLGEPPAAAPAFDPDAPPMFDVSVIRNPDEAGRRVVRGIKRGDLYILTHVEFKQGFEARAAAILRAFPDEEPSEAFIKEFPYLIENKIFEKQTAVPALDK